jgi:pimeloyl-ACP methyl ester carboxylesterase
VSATSAKLFETVLGANVEIIDGPGHSPMADAPAKTLDLIKSFLGALSWQHDKGGLDDQKP